MDDPTAYLHVHPALSTKARVAIALLGPALSTALGLFLGQSHAIRSAEQKSLDWRFAVRGALPVRDDVVVVEIDEDSRRGLAAEGRRFDLRRHLGPAIDHLADAGAKVVALDVWLDGLGDPAVDASLAEAIGGANVVLAATHSGGHIKRAPEVFRESNPYEGLVTVYPDADGVLRRLPAPPHHLYLNVPRDDGSFSYIPHFPLVIAWLAMAHSDPDARIRFDDLGGWVGTRRVDRGELVDFIALGGTQSDAGHSSARAFRSLSFADVVQNRFDAPTLDGAVVLVGEARTIADTFHFPPDPQRQTPGVYYHANVVAQILDGRRFDATFCAPTRRNSLAAALGLGCGLLAWRPRRWWTSRHAGWLLAAHSCLAVALFPVGWTAICVWGFSRHMLLPWATPVLAMSLGIATGAVGQASLLSVTARRYMQRARQIEAVFGRCVSTRVLEALKQDPAEIEETRVRDVSVLFCDMRGFTARAAEEDPARVAAMLNEYFAHITEAVFENEGFLDKFVGDEVMAAFSVPFEQPDHADRAVRTAIGIKQGLTRLNKALAARGDSPLNCGIGIDSGPAATGHIGSARRSNYTLIGHTVNMAARIQGLARDGEILISQRVRDRLTDVHAVRFWQQTPLRGAPGVHALYVVHTPTSIT